MSLKDRVNKSRSIDITPDVPSYYKMFSRLKAVTAQALFTNRKKQKRSQSELASVLGVKQAMISQWERGDCNYSYETISKLASALNMDIEISFHEKVLSENTIRKNGQILNITDNPRHAAINTLFSVKEM